MEAVLALCHSCPPCGYHRAALVPLGRAGLHVAAAEPAGAVQQLVAALADGQPRPVDVLRGADGFVQRGHVFRDDRGHFRLACIPQQAPALLAGISHGSGQAQPD